MVNSVAAGLKTVSLRIVGFRPKRIGRYGWTLCSSADNYIGERLEAGNTEVRPIFYIGNRNDCRICVVTHISEIYSEIQQQDKAMGTNRAQALIEELAGKNRSNILSSLLTNGSLLEQVKETSEHSDNSAQEENQKYLESTEAKIAQLQTQLQELATVTINSDMFKGVIDTATAFLNIVTQILDKLPLLSTAIGGLAGFKLSKAGLGKQLNIKLVSI